MRHIYSNFYRLFFPSISFAVVAEYQWNVTLTIKRGAPEAYVVVKGDTLWEDISVMWISIALGCSQGYGSESRDRKILTLFIPETNCRWFGLMVNLSWSLKPVIKLSPKIRVSGEESSTYRQRGASVLPYLQSDSLGWAARYWLGATSAGNKRWKRFLSGEDRLFISETSSILSGGIYRAVETVSKAAASSEYHFCAWLPLRA